MLAHVASPGILAVSFSCLFSHSSALSLANSSCTKPCSQDRPPSSEVHRCSSGDAPTTSTDDPRIRGLLFVRRATCATTQCMELAGGRGGRTCNMQHASPSLCRFSLTWLSSEFGCSELSVHACWLRTSTGQIVVAAVSPHQREHCWVWSSQAINMESALSAIVYLGSPGGLSRRPARVLTSLPFSPTMEQVHQAV